MTFVTDVTGLVMGKFWNRCRWDGFYHFYFTV